MKSLSLLLALALVVGGAAAASPVRQNMTVCMTTRNSAGTTNRFLLMRHAVEYYASRPPFDQHNWTVKHLVANSNALVKDAILGIIQSAAGCHVLLGPGSSATAVAEASVVDFPWLDYAATSTDLSSDTNYPWFDRICPSDAAIGSGMVDVAVGMGWRTINVVCINEANGRSVSGAIADRVAAVGGSIGYSACFEPSVANASAFGPYFDSLRATSRSRVVAVAMAVGFTTFVALRQYIIQYEVWREFVFIFTESACSGDAQWRAIPGALCVTYYTNPTPFAGFLTSFQSRNTTPDVAYMASYGVTFDATTLRTRVLTTYNVFGALAHDSVIHAMTSLVNAVNNGTALTNTRGVRSVMRASNSTGYTGAINLDATGDRLGAQLVVMNVNMTGGENAIGYVTASHGVIDLNYSSPLPAVTLLGREYATGDARPPAYVSDPPQLIAVWMVAIAASAVAVLIVISLALCIARHNEEVVAKLVAGGYILHGTLVVTAVTVVVIRVLVAVDLFVSGTPASILGPTVALLVLSVVAEAARVLTRVRYLLAVLQSEGLVSPADQAKWDELFFANGMTNLALSDLTAIGIGIAVLVTGQGATLGLVLAQIIFAAIRVGRQGGSLPAQFAALRDRLAGGAHDEDADDDTLGGAGQDGDAMDPADKSGQDFVVQVVPCADQAQSVRFERSVRNTMTPRPPQPRTALDVFRHNALVGQLLQCVKPVRISRQHLTDFVLPSFARALNVNIPAAPLQIHDEWSDGAATPRHEELVHIHDGSVRSNVAVDKGIAAIPDLGATLSLIDTPQQVLAVE